MANVNIRIDSTIKEGAEKVFAKLGLTPTTAIVLFYNQVIRTNSIPFELRVDVPNDVTMKAIQEVEEMEKNPNSKTFKTVRELMEDLNKWLTELGYPVNSKKDYKTCVKRGLNVEEFEKVLKLLKEGAVLPEKYRDHPLQPSREYKNCRELHIQLDWLLIYKYSNESVILYLVRTGSHSDLFKWWVYVQKDTGAYTFFME